MQYYQAITKMHHPNELQEKYVFEIDLQWCIQRKLEPTPQIAEHFKLCLRYLCPRHL